MNIAQTNINIGKGRCAESPFKKHTTHTIWNRIKPFRGKAPRTCCNGMCFRFDSARLLQIEISDKKKNFRNFSAFTRKFIDAVSSMGRFCFALLYCFFNSDDVIWHIFCQINERVIVVCVAENYCLLLYLKMTIHILLPSQWRD